MATLASKDGPQAAATAKPITPTNNMRAHRLWKDRTPQVGPQARARRDVDEVLRSLLPEHRPRKGQAGTSATRGTTSDYGEAQGTEGFDMWTGRGATQAVDVPATPSVARPGMPQPTFVKSDESSRGPAPVPGLERTDLKQLRSHRMWRGREAAVSPRAAARRDMRAALGAGLMANRTTRPSGEETDASMGRSGIGQEDAQDSDTHLAGLPTYARDASGRAAVYVAELHPRDASRGRQPTRGQDARAAGGAAAGMGPDDYTRTVRRLQGHRLWKARESSASPEQRAATALSGLVGDWAGSASKKSSRASSAPVRDRKHAIVADGDGTSVTSVEHRVGARGDDQRRGEPGAGMVRGAVPPAAAGGAVAGTAADTVRRLRSHRLWRQRDSSASPDQRKRDATMGFVAEWAAAAGHAAGASSATSRSSPRLERRRGGLRDESDTAPVPDQASREQRAVHANRQHQPPHTVDTGNDQQLGSVHDEAGGRGRDATAKRLRVHRLWLARQSSASPERRAQEAVGSVIDDWASTAAAAMPGRRLSMQRKSHPGPSRAASCTDRSAPGHNDSLAAIHDGGKYRDDVALVASNERAAHRPLDARGLSGGGAPDAVADTIQRLRGHRLWRQRDSSASPDQRKRDATMGFVAEWAAAAGHAAGASSATPRSSPRSEPRRGGLRHEPDTAPVPDQASFEGRANRQHQPRGTVNTGHDQHLGSVHHEAGGRGRDATVKRLRVHRLWKARQSSASPERRAQAAVGSVMDDWAATAAAAMPGRRLSMQREAHASPHRSAPLTHHTSDHNISVAATYGGSRHRADALSVASTTVHEHQGTRGRVHAGAPDRAADAIQRLRGHRLWRQRESSASPERRAQAAVDGFIADWAGAAAAIPSREERNAQASPARSTLCTPRGPPERDVSATVTYDGSKHRDGMGLAAGGEGKAPGRPDARGRARNEGVDGVARAIQRIRDHCLWRERESSASPERRAQAVVGSVVSDWAASGEQSAAGARRADEQQRGTHHRTVRPTWQDSEPEASSDGGGRGGAGHDATAANAQGRKGQARASRDVRASAPAVQLPRHSQTSGPPLVQHPARSPSPPTPSAAPGSAPLLAAHPGAAALPGPLFTLVAGPQGGYVLVPLAMGQAAPAPVYTGATAVTEQPAPATAMATQAGVSLGPGRHRTLQPAGGRGRATSSVGGADPGGAVPGTADGSGSGGSSTSSDALLTPEERRQQRAATPSIMSVQQPARVTGPEPERDGARGRKSSGASSTSASPSPRLPEVEPGPVADAEAHQHRRQAAALPQGPALPPQLGVDPATAFSAARSHVATTNHWRPASPPPIAAAAAQPPQERPAPRADYLPIVNITAQLETVIARLQQLRTAASSRVHSPLRDLAGDRSRSTSPSARSPSHRLRGILAHSSPSRRAERVDEAAQAARGSPRHSTTSFSRSIALQSAAFNTLNMRPLRTGQSSHPPPVTHAQQAAGWGDSNDARQAGGDRWSASQALSGATAPTGMRAATYPTSGAQQRGVGAGASSTFSMASARMPRDSVQLGGFTPPLPRHSAGVAQLSMADVLPPKLDARAFERGRRTELQRSFAAVLEARSAARLPALQAAFQPPNPVHASTQQAGGTIAAPPAGLHDRASQLGGLSRPASTPQGVSVPTPQYIAALVEEQPALGLQPPAELGPVSPEAVLPVGIGMRQGNRGVTAPGDSTALPPSETSVAGLQQPRRATAPAAPPLRTVAGQLRRNLQQQVPPPPLPAAPPPTDGTIASQAQDAGLRGMSKGRSMSDVIAMLARPLALPSQRFSLAAAEGSEVCVQGQGCQPSDGTQLSSPALGDAIRHAPTAADPQRQPSALNAVPVAGRRHTTAGLPTMQHGRQQQTARAAGRASADQVPRAPHVVSPIKLHALLLPIKGAEAHLRAPGDQPDVPDANDTTDMLPVPAPQPESAQDLAGLAGAVGQGWGSAEHQEELLPELLPAGFSTPAALVTRHGPRVFAVGSSDVRAPFAAPEPPYLTETAAIQAQPPLDPSHPRMDGAAALGASVSPDSAQRSCDSLRQWVGEVDWQGAVLAAAGITASALAAAAAAAGATSGLGRPDVVQAVLEQPIEVDTAVASATQFAPTSLSAMPSQISVASAQPGGGAGLGRRHTSSAGGSACDDRPGSPSFSAAAPPGLPFAPPSVVRDEDEPGGSHADAGSQSALTVVRTSQAGRLVAQQSSAMKADVQQEEEEGQHAVPDTGGVHEQPFDLSHVDSSLASFEAAEPGTPLATLPHPQLLQSRSSEAAPGPRTQPPQQPPAPGAAAAGVSAWMPQPATLATINVPLKLVQSRATQTEAPACCVDAATSPHAASARQSGAGSVSGASVASDVASTALTSPLPFPWPETLPMRVVPESPTQPHAQALQAVHHHVFVVWDNAAFSVSSSWECPAGVGGGGGGDHPAAPHPAFGDTSVPNPPTLATSSSPPGSTLAQCDVQAPAPSPEAPIARAPEVQTPAADRRMSPHSPDVMLRVDFGSPVVAGSPAPPPGRYGSAQSCVERSPLSPGASSAAFGLEECSRPTPLAKGPAPVAVAGGLCEDACDDDDVLCMATPLPGIGEYTSPAPGLAPPLASVTPASLSLRLHATLAAVPGQEPTWPGPPPYTRFVPITQPASELPPERATPALPPGLWQAVTQEASQAAEVAAVYRSVVGRLSSTLLRLQTPAATLPPPPPAARNGLQASPTFPAVVTATATVRSPTRVFWPGAQQAPLQDGSLRQQEARQEMARTSTAQLLSRLQAMNRQTQATTRLLKDAGAQPLPVGR